MKCPPINYGIFFPDVRSNKVLLKCSYILLYFILHKYCTFKYMILTFFYMHTQCTCLKENMMRDTKVILSRFVVCNASMMIEKYIFLV